MLEQRFGRGLDGPICTTKRSSDGNHVMAVARLVVAQMFPRSVCTKSISAKDTLVSTELRIAQFVS